MERSDAQIRLPHFCGLEEVAQHTRYDLAGDFISPVKIRTQYKVHPNDADVSAAATDVLRYLFSDYSFDKSLSKQIFFDPSIYVSSFAIRVTKPPWPDPSMKSVQISWIEFSVGLVVIH